MLGCFPVDEIAIVDLHGYVRFRPPPPTIEGMSMVTYQSRIALTVSRLEQAKR
jgi:hypothetical protein